MPAAYWLIPPAIQGRPSYVHASRVARGADAARFPRSCGHYAAGIIRSYMSKLERAASYPGLEIIAKLATVLECDPAELLRVSGRPNT